MSVASFQLDLKKFAKQLDLDLELVTRKIAFDLYTDITQMTPVDTGRAKANWNIGFRNINTQITDNTVFTPVDIPKGAGKHAIYITNHLPYIGVLENGSSKQAPSGMVKVSMNNLKSRLSSVIR